MTPRPPPTISTAPLKGYTHTIILLHDAGETAHTLSSWMQKAPAGKSLKQSFPTVRWVFPSAAARPVPGAAATEEEATAGEAGSTSRWFDAWDEEAAGLRESVGRLWQILHQEAGKLEGRWDRIVVGQGASVATQTLLELRVPSSSSSSPGEQSDAASERPPGLGALIGISGQHLPVTESSRQTTSNPESAIGSTPTLLQHCAGDVTVPLERGYALRDVLIGMGLDVTWRQYSTEGHGLDGLDAEGVGDFKEFLRRVIAPGDVEGPVAMPREVQIFNRWA